MKQGSTACVSLLRIVYKHMKSSKSLLFVHRSMLDYYTKKHNVAATDKESLTPTRFLPEKKENLYPTDV